jgi:hypothetical protein
MKFLVPCLERLTLDLMPYVLLMAATAGLFVVLAGAIFLSIWFENWHESRRQRAWQSRLLFRGAASTNQTILIGNPVAVTS